MNSTAVPRKVAIFAGYYFPHVGGYEKNIARFARELANRGAAVEIACTTPLRGQNRTTHVGDGISVQYLRSVGLLKGEYPVPISLLQLSRLFRHLAKDRPEVAITQTRFFAICVVGGLFAKILGIPLVHVERGSDHSPHANKSVELAARIYDHTMGSWLCRSANQRVAISSGAMGFIAHISGREARVIPNGIDTPTTSLSSERMSLNPIEPSRSQKPLDVIAVGRLVYLKGFQDLISAMGRLNKSDKAFRLVIVGDGPHRPDLERLGNAELGPNQIRFIGEVSPVDVLQLIAQADVLVNPSYTEGLPSSVMEAMMVGTPVIATDVGGTRDLVIDHETGLLIPTKSPDAIARAIRELAQDRVLASRLAKNAKGFTTTRFVWDDVIRAWHDVFVQLRILGARVAGESLG